MAKVFVYFICPVSNCEFAIHYWVNYYVFIYFTISLKGELYLNQT